MNRIFSIELLRVVCAVTVVIDHIAIAAIGMYKSTASDVDRFVYYGIQHWSHFAVPVFLMISGFLLLNPQKEIEYGKAITKYTKRMVVVLLTVGTFFAFLEVLFESHQINFHSVGRALLYVFEGKGWQHMWYLYMIIGIYLVLPILKAAYNGISRKTLSTFLVLMFLFTSVIPMISLYTGINCGIKFPIMSIFLFYFILGRWVFETGSKHFINPTVLYVITIVLMFTPVWVSYLEHIKGFHLLVKLTGYDSPLIVVISVFIVFSVMNMGGVKGRRLAQFVEHLGNNSFGIYVFHMLWINLIYKFFHYNPIEHNVFFFILLILLVVVLSDITTMMFKKLPFIGSSI